MKRITILFIHVALILFCVSCKREVPLKTYTVTLDMQPDNASNTGLDGNKNIFLSLGSGEIFNSDGAKANSSKIDLVLYDGTTTTTSIGDIHWVSPGGGTLSMNTASGVYLYREAGNTTSSVRFYELTGMDEWTTYNPTKIRDQSGLSGFSETDFDELAYESEYLQAIEKIQKPGTDNSNVAKKIMTVANNSLVSKVWYFEFQSVGAVNTAIAKITDYRHLPDGFVILEVKMLN